MPRIASSIKSWNPGNYDFCNLIGSFCKTDVFVESGTKRHADSRTAKHLLPESTTKSVESGTNDVICQFCTVKGMVVESEVLKAQNCALSKFSLPMHSNAPPSAKRQ